MAAARYTSPLHKNHRDNHGEGRRVDSYSPISADTTSFYFTNIPSNIQYVELRKGLEVCGILTNVFISRNCNSKGHLYGFARFLKVRNVDKL